MQTTQTTRLASLALLVTPLLFSCKKSSGDCPGKRKGVPSVEAYNAETRARWRSGAAANARLEDDYVIDYSSTALYTISDSKTGVAEQAFITTIYTPDGAYSGNLVGYVLQDDNIFRTGHIKDPQPPKPSETSGGGVKALDGNPTLRFTVTGNQVTKVYPEQLNDPDPAVNEQRAWAAAVGNAALGKSFAWSSTGEYAALLPTQEGSSRYSIEPAMGKAGTVPMMVVYGFSAIRSGQYQLPY